MYSEYDEERFFAEYAKMPRSREGLAAAGEWHQLRPLFPPLCQKKVWDLGCDVIKQHHMLTQILMGLLQNGFSLEAVEEARPSEEMLGLPCMKDELRRPMMLLVKASAKK